ncbi:hypothetical protein N2152v2_002532 [Parachlorella kessleri]
MGGMAYQRAQSWSPVWSDTLGQNEGPELPLSASTQFVSGHNSQLYYGSGGRDGKRQLDLSQQDSYTVSLPGSRSSDAIRAYSPAPQVYETLAELSLTNSPAKHYVTHQQAAAAPTFVSERTLERDLRPGALPSRRPSSQAEDLERSNAELLHRVAELQERLAAAEEAAISKRTPARGPAAHPADADREVRELQSRLAARQREAAAGQQALEHARAEAKACAAQLQQERSRSAGLEDEVARWRDEYHKLKKEFAALARKLENTAAQGSLLDGNVGALKRQNAELSKALAQQESASSDLQEKMQALRSHEASQIKQLQQLTQEVEVLHGDNAALQQQQHNYIAEDANRHSQVQQLWDEREQLFSENTSLRQQVQDLNAELHHMGQAFAGARRQLQDSMAREHNLADKANIQQFSGQQTNLQLPASVSAGPYRPAFSQMQRPGTGQAVPAGEGQHVHPNAVQELQRAQSSHGLAHSHTGRSEHALQQSWAALHQSMRGSSMEAAAAHAEWQRRGLEMAQSADGSRAGPPPPAMRSLSFEGQHAVSNGTGLERVAVSIGGGPVGWSSSGQGEEAVGPSHTPLERSGSGFNPRVSLPHPYSLPQAFRGVYVTPEGPQMLGNMESSAAVASYSNPSEAAQAGAVAEEGRNPGSVEGHAQRARLSSNEEVSTAAGSALKSQAGAGASPFGNDISLSEMLARTQAMETRLMKLSMEKNDLEAEYARMPTSTAGRKLQDRRRKQEIEERLEAVNKEISSIRLQLKRMGYK